MAPSAKAQRFVNRWGARFIPLILVGIAGYTTWVVPVLIGVNRLLNPSNQLAPRTGAGIAVIVLYFVLLVPMAVSYTRTIYIVLTRPGYVPQPAKEKRRHQRKSRRRRGSRQTDEEKVYSHSEVSGPTPSQQVGYLDRGAVYGGRLEPPPGLDQFLERDVFECEIDGLPRWCSTCQSWKPDRSHHSSEVGRCVYKLDHFCPWAAGIVSESSLKPFLLFCAYGSLYCIFVLVVGAYFTAEQHRLRERRSGETLTIYCEQGELYNVNYIVVIVLAGLFGLFASGMAGNTMHAVLINSTTVDNLTRRSRIHHFCVLLPSSHQPTVSTNYYNSNATDRRPVPIPTITYPLHGQETGRAAPIRPKTYAILATPAGSNPYSLSSKLENGRTVLGEHIWEWFWPFRSSPCERHAHQDQTFGTMMYKLGPALSRVMAENGIPQHDFQRVSTNENATRRSQRPSAGDTEVAPAQMLAQTHSATERYAPQGSVTMSRLQESRRSGNS